MSAPTAAPTLTQKAEDLVHAFCGLGLALLQFRVEHSYSYFAGPPRANFIVHQKDGDGWRFRNSVSIPDEDARALGTIKLLTWNSLAAEKKLDWVRHGLSRMRAVLSAGDRAKGILLACQWLFQARTSRDELLAYVHAMVVLETLLGEDDFRKDMSLGALLRNRCAYLIGSDRQERSDLMVTFQKIYEVRSQIVHRGKHSFSAKERELLGQLMAICQRVINKEIELLLAEKPSIRSAV